MNQRVARLGGLNCITIDELAEGQPPQVVAVFCHGFGAPGTDLVSLGPELLAMNPALRNVAQFVFPAAPLELDAFGMFGGRAWWMIDINRLTAAIESGELRDMRNDVPAGLTEARAMLTAVVDEICQATDLPLSRVVLGGFSQGSMLAADVALRLPEPPGALSVFSGTLLCETEWRELAAQRGELPVLQSHGRQDPILPFQAAEWLREMFVEAGLSVDFLPFDGMHTISREAVVHCAELLGRVAAS